MVNELSQFRAGEEIPYNKISNFLTDELGIYQEEPLKIVQFTEGYSNLTYGLKKGKWSGVLRRPPHGKLPPKAHDMGREFKILENIHPYYSEAPKPLYYTDEEQLIGKPFLLMEWKHGLSLEKSYKEKLLNKDKLQKVSKLFIENLNKIHNIPYENTALLGQSQPEAFLERQVHGLIKRFEAAKLRDYEYLKELYLWFEENMPKQQYVTIIHNDYKLNNILFAEDFESITGVVDWEMTTIGDPLFDLAIAMSYWMDNTDSSAIKNVAGLDHFTRDEGFLTRNELIQYYGSISGRNLGNMDYYLSFAYFKLAVICAQIYKRYALGQTKDARFEGFDTSIETLIRHAWQLAGGVKHG